MIQSTLMIETQRLLLHRDRSLQLAEIAKQCNVSVEWLKMFSTGRINDPSVNKIERLYTYFTGQAVIVKSDA